MSNYKKTLADVQPGGRVRLGDGLPPLPKAGYVTGGDFGHEAHNAFTPEQMREYALAALSAQPSPGGQGDARALIQRYDAAGAKFRESLMDDHYSDAQRVELRRELTAVQDELLTALAARQPVGPEEAHILPPLATESMLDAGWPCGEVIDRTFDRQGAYADLVAAAPAIARQPVGEPVACVRDLLPQEVLSAISAVAVIANKESPHPVQKYIDTINAWLYAAPPAQAVDLGAVREALQAAEGLATVCASVDGYSREEVAASGRAMKQRFADALAKVDSQAVGNG